MYHLHNYMVALTAMVESGTIWSTKDQVKAGIVSGNKAQGKGDNAYKWRRTLLLMRHLNYQCDPVEIKGKVSSFLQKQCSHIVDDEERLKRFPQAIQDASGKVWEYYKLKCLPPDQRLSAKFVEMGSIASKWAIHPELIFIRQRKNAPAAPAVVAPAVVAAPAVSAANEVKENQ